MNEISNSALYLWLVLVTVVLIYLLLVNRLNAYMRRAHSAQWDALGAPTFFNNSIANNIKFLRYFVFTSGYRRLDDSRVNRIVMVVRILAAFSVALFVTVITFGYHR